MSGPAADIYKEVLDRVDTRPKKWRITTYDQAAECFRRWAEQNKAMRDTESFKQHIDTACKILEKAAGTNDFDDHTGILYTNVVEDSIFFALATKDEGYAISQLQRIADAGHILHVAPFRLLRIENITRVFGEDSFCHDAVARLSSRLEWAENEGGTLKRSEERIHQGDPTRDQLWVHNGHGRQRLVLSQICSRQIHHLVRSQGGSCGNVRS